jgi:hypothetical protein
MKHRIPLIATMFAVAATSVACGGDDGGGDTAGPQAQLATELIADVGVEGISLDESCVREVTARLSDADARRLLDGDEAELSADGNSTLLGIFECIEVGDFDFGDFDLEDPEP